MQNFDNSDKSKKKSNNPFKSKKGSDKAKTSKVNNQRENNDDSASQNASYSGSQSNSQSSTPTSETRKKASSSQSSTPNSEKKSSSSPSSTSKSETQKKSSSSPLSLKKAISPKILFKQKQIETTEIAAEIPKKPTLEEFLKEQEKIIMNARSNVNNQNGIFSGEVETLKAMQICLIKLELLNYFTQLLNTIKKEKPDSEILNKYTNIESLLIEDDEKFKKNWSQQDLQTAINWNISALETIEVQLKYDDIKICKRKLHAPDLNILNLTDLIDNMEDFDFKEESSEVLVRLINLIRTQLGLKKDHPVYMLIEDCEILQLSLKINKITPEQVERINAEIYIRIGRAFHIDLGLVFNNFIISTFDVSMLENALLENKKPLLDLDDLKSMSPEECAEIMGVDVSTRENKPSEKQLLDLDQQIVDSEHESLGLNPTVESNNSFEETNIPFKIDNKIQPESIRVHLRLEQSFENRRRYDDRDVCIYAPEEAAKMISGEISNRLKGKTYNIYNPKMHAYLTKFNSLSEENTEYLDKHFPHNVFYVLVQNQIWYSYPVKGKHSDIILLGEYTEDEIRNLQFPNSPEAAEGKLANILLLTGDAHLKVEKEILQSVTIDEQLTLPQFMSIARNETKNTEGLIQFEQYKGLTKKDLITGEEIIDEEIIYKFKDTVREFITIGMDTATHQGGYFSKRIEEKPHKVIIIDLIGLQFQKKYNTGYRKCDTMVGFAADLYRQEVAKDFVNTVLALENYAENIKLDKFIEFRFLAYGTNNFAGEYKTSIKANILEGIKQGLENLNKIFNNNKTKLKYIKIFSFPFYGDCSKDDETIRNEIGKLCKYLSAKCSFETKDALAPLKDSKSSKYIVATTTCADPHVQPGNEIVVGGSVDSTIAANLKNHLDHFSPCLNHQIKAKVISRNGNISNYSDYAAKVISDNGNISNYSDYTANVDRPSSPVIISSQKKEILIGHQKSFVPSTPANTTYTTNTTSTTSTTSTTTTTDSFLRPQTSQKSSSFVNEKDYSDVKFSIKKGQDKEIVEAIFTDHKLAGKFAQEWLDNFGIQGEQGRPRKPAMSDQINENKYTLILDATEFNTIMDDNEAFAKLVSNGDQDEINFPITEEKSIITKSFETFVETNKPSNNNINSQSNTNSSLTQSRRLHYIQQQTNSQYKKNFGVDDDFLNQKQVTSYYKSKPGTTFFSQESSSSNLSKSTSNFIKSEQEFDTTIKSEKLNNPSLLGSQGTFKQTIKSPEFMPVGKMIAKIKEAYEDGNFHLLENWININLECAKEAFNKYNGKNPEFKKVIKDIFRKGHNSLVECLFDILKPHTMFDVIQGSGTDDKLAKFILKIYLNNNMSQNDKQNITRGVEGTYCIYRLISHISSLANVKNHKLDIAKEEILQIFNFIYDFSQSTTDFKDKLVSMITEMKFKDFSNFSCEVRIKEFCNALSDLDEETIKAGFDKCKHLIPKVLPAVKWTENDTQQTNAMFKK